MKNMQKLVIWFIVLICIGLSEGNGKANFNVLDYGAVGDGKHDDSQVNPIRISHG